MDPPTCWERLHLILSGVFLGEFSELRISKNSYTMKNLFHCSIGSCTYRSETGKGLKGTKTKVNSQSKNGCNIRMEFSRMERKALNWLSDKVAWQWLRLCLQDEKGYSKSSKKPRNWAKCFAPNRSKRKVPSPAAGHTNLFGNWDVHSRPEQYHFFTPIPIPNIFKEALAIPNTNTNFMMSP